MTLYKCKWCFDVVIFKTLVTKSVKLELKFVNSSDIMLFHLGVHCVALVHFLSLCWYKVILDPWQMIHFLMNKHRPRWKCIHTCYSGSIEKNDDDCFVKTLYAFSGYVHVAHFISAFNGRCHNSFLMVITKRRISQLQFCHCHECSH